MDDNNETVFSGPEGSGMKWRDYSFEDYLSLGIFWMLIALVLAQVISRYVFNNSIIWSEELARYHFIVLTFIGSNMVVRKDSLIKIEFFIMYLPFKIRYWLSLVVNIIELGFLTATTYLAWQMFLFMCAKKMVSINVSMGFLYASVFFGILCNTIRTYQLFIRRLRHSYNDLVQ
jgi:TRAP-type C4-dicarboxylate transport system permease small subunit